MTQQPASTTGVRVGTILFTDLVGFTEYTDAAGDEAALRVLEHQTEMMAGLVTKRANARIVKELGDGLMVWFDTPADGIDCATAMLNAVETIRAENGFPVAIRMGLHHGEMLPRGEDLVGATVNIAARIAGLAGPSELLVSEAALDACGDQPLAARLDPVGPAPVKGVAEPVWLLRVSSS